MSPIVRIFKGLVFWSYGRSTWQYDVLCVLILVFVFLTPKTWFEQSELKRRAAHQNGSAAAMTLLIRPDNLGPNPGAQEIERHARAVTGRPGARVKGVRETRDAAGRVVSYEVDIE